MLLRTFGYLFSIVVFLTSLSAEASVTLLGSRIIYSSDAKSIDIVLKNNDTIPYVIQTWFDRGNEHSTPADSSDTPFIVTPPVFRIQPQTGQIARIMYSATKALPSDRESLFWFNMLEIPPMTQGATSQSNAMMVMLRNRVKVFYRPIGLGDPTNVLDGLKVSRVYSAEKGHGLLIANPQPWFVSLVNIQLGRGKDKQSLRAEMLSPFSEKTFPVSTSGKSLQDQGIVTLSAINDQGARISETYHPEDKKY